MELTKEIREYYIKFLKELRFEICIVIDMCQTKDYTKQSVIKDLRNITEMIKTEEKKK